MKTFLTLLFISIALLGKSQTISTQQAKDNIGKTVTVCGTVAKVFTSKKGNIFLNFDKSYPHQTFSGTIFMADSYRFTDIENYTGKNICITGIIKIYNAKPEIVIKTPEQIKIQ